MKSHLQVDDPWQESGPANANSLRWAEFRRLMRLPETRGWLFGAVVGGGVLGLLVNVSTAWVLPVLAVLIGLGVVFWIADRNAARGTLALYTYEEETIGLSGRRETSYHELTIAAAEVPKCAPYIQGLFVLARRGPRVLGKFGDRFLRGLRRVTLESEELDKRFEIFVGEGQDEVWTRRLFSPAFVVWLAESAPRELSVELVEGTLVATFPAASKTRRASTEWRRWRRSSGAACWRSPRRRHQGRGRLPA